ncbi:hypothetical protein [Streptomyces sp. NPDC088270]|uniref:hypothetical protein n=1 Tax=Streptomyces sp. NPDC088270 TaxID=3160990 RepID=UPI0034157D07
MKRRAARISSLLALAVTAAVGAGAIAPPALAARSPPTRSGPRSTTRRPAPHCAA